MGVKIIKKIPQQNKTKNKFCLEYKTIYFTLHSL